MPIISQWKEFDEWINSLPETTIFKHDCVYGSCCAMFYQHISNTKTGIVVPKLEKGLVGTSDGSYVWCNTDSMAQLARYCAKNRVKTVAAAKKFAIMSFTIEELASVPVTKRFRDNIPTFHVLYTDENGVQQKKKFRMYEPNISWNCPKEDADKFCRYLLNKGLSDAVVVDSTSAEYTDIMQDRLDYQYRHLGIL